MKRILNLIYLLVFFSSCNSNFDKENNIINKYKLKQYEIYSNKCEIIWLQKRKYEEKTDSVKISFVYFRKSIKENVPDNYLIKCNNGNELIKIDSTVLFINKDSYYKLKYKDAKFLYSLSDIEEILSVFYNPNFFVLTKIIKSENDKNIMKIELKKKDININNYLASSKLFVENFYSVFFDTIQNRVIKYILSIDTSFCGGGNVYYNNLLVESHIENDLKLNEEILNQFDISIKTKKCVNISKDFEIFKFIFDYKMPYNSISINEKRNFDYNESLLLANGDSIKISDFKGKYVFIDFWFTNCPGCMIGIPKINNIYKKYKNKNLIVLGINPIDKNIKAIYDVSIKHNINYMVCKSPIGYEKLFNINYFPSYILLYPNQKYFETINLNNESKLKSFMKKLDKKL